MSKIFNFVLSLVAMLTVHSAAAHHSSVGIYDTTRRIEIEGIVTAARWRNPHPAYTVAVVDENGATADWHVEAGSISTLRVRGVGRDFIEVGDRVRLAGEPSMRGRRELFARNMLLEDGREVLLSAASTPYWAQGQEGNLYEAAVDAERVELGRQAATGIFRVWSTVPNDADSWPLYGAGISPLTAAALRRKAEWDPRASPYLGCEPKGMPYIMNSAYPLEFVRQGEDILLHLEESDTRRLIHIGSAETAAEYSAYGYSAGHWDGNTLVVETGSVDAPYFYGDGTPQSRSIRLTEYFTLSENEDKLDYRLLVDDPETFTETLEFTRYWEWRPDLSVEPYNCEP